MPRFIPWHRPETWIPHEQLPELRLFRRTIYPAQVTHGSIGNTYFISTMAALAERPIYLHNLFRHPISSANGKAERALGAYWVTINFNGWWIPVLLDDYVPATRDGPEFAHCASDIRRMWVSLLEKSYAKVHGSYANIASGDPLEPLTELTGFPVTRFASLWDKAKSALTPKTNNTLLTITVAAKTEKGAATTTNASTSVLPAIGKSHTSVMQLNKTCTSDTSSNAIMNENKITNSTEEEEDNKNAVIELFDKICAYQQAGYLQMVCTPSDGGESYGNTNVVCANPELEAKYNKIGLRLHHGYVILQAIYIKEYNLRLLQIRNPWGTGAEWDGNWSKRDKQWERMPEVAKVCYRHYNSVGHHVNTNTDNNNNNNKLSNVASSPSSSSSYADEDGTFWMEWSDVLHYFIHGGCCHVHYPWYDYRIRGSFSKAIPSISLEVNVSAATTAYIMLSQIDERDEPNDEYDALLLAIFAYNGKKQKLEATSNTFIEEPDSQLRFNFSREVAMKFTFVPEHCPYYVIPRIHDPNVNKPYILGFLPDTYAGNGVRVDFVKLSESCKVFSNMPSFVAAGVCEDVAAEYQIRTPRQPIECIGTELKDDRLSEFGVQESNE